MNYLRIFLLFVRDLLLRRHMILELAKQDFRSKYLGSYLGILWAFIHPTIYVSILWLVFQVGFKSQPAGDVPFVLWMLCGIIPWFFFSDCLNSATLSILDNSFLLKKVNFSVGMLPIVKILSALVLHVFFILVIFGMFLIYHTPVTVHSLQIVYYLFCTIVLLLGLSWLTSSVIIFFRDMGQIVSMVLQFLFWMTPIFWSAKILPAKYLNMVKLNPVYYIVEGYRESFIYHVWFWEGHYSLTAYFWGVTGFIFVSGAVVFRRLRPHFADVL
jgi:lipopolysaccharide transport system permease protein/teichoic acid transport system permease protein